MIDLVVPIVFWFSRMWFPLAFRTSLLVFFLILIFPLTKQTIHIQYMGHCATSPDGRIVFGVPNQTRIEPCWSPARQMPSRLQNGHRSRASTIADPDAQVSGYKGHQIYTSWEESFAAVNGRLESRMRTERRRFVATLVVLISIAAILFSIPNRNISS